MTGITYPLPGTHSWAATTTVSYGYDNADQLTGVTDFNGHQITITPNADGLDAAVSLGASGDSINTTWDSADAPSVIALKNSSGTMQSFTYSDAPSGSILSETDTPSSAQSPAMYAYDAQGRVTSDTPGTGSADSYSFDASGGLTTLPTGGSTIYNNAGELTSSTLAGTTISYTYNADGEQRTSVQGSTTESAATWNGAGQLTTYDNAAADMTSATYDGTGLRTSTTITPSGGSAVTQGYVWNAQQLLMDGTNAYIYSDSTAPAEQVSLATGAITYLVADRLGSVRGTVGSAGALTATTAYDAWGNPESTGGLTAVTPFGYAGGYTDTTGLVYLINRYYSPQLGQFTSVDPDLAGTLQPYAYADDDPVLSNDPTGLDSHYTNCKPPAGGYPVSVCIQTDDDHWTHGWWWADANFYPSTDNVLIRKVAASSIGLNVCGKLAHAPTNSDSCSHKPVDCETNPWAARASNLNTMAEAYGSGVNGGWNWIRSYINGAWAESPSGMKSKPVSLNNKWIRTCINNCKG